MSRESPLSQLQEEFDGVHRKLAALAREHASPDLTLKDPATGERVLVLAGFEAHVHQLERTARAIVTETGYDMHGGSKKGGGVKHQSCLLAVLGTSKYATTGLTGEVCTRTLLNHNGPNSVQKINGDPKPPEMKPSTQRTLPLEQFGGLEGMLHYHGDEEDNRTVAILKLWSEASMLLMALSKLCVYSAHIDQFEKESVTGGMSSASMVVAAHANGDLIRQLLKLKKQEKPDLKNPEHRDALLQLMVGTKDSKGLTPFSVPYRVDSNGDARVVTGSGIANQMMVINDKDGKPLSEKKTRELWAPAISVRKRKFEQMAARAGNPQDVGATQFEQIDKYMADGVDWLCERGIPPQTPAPMVNGRARSYVALLDRDGREVKLVQEDGTERLLNTREYAVACDTLGGLVLAFVRMRQGGDTTHYGNLESVQEVLPSAFLYLLNKEDAAPPRLRYKWSDMRGTMRAFVGGASTNNVAVGQAAIAAATAGLDDDYAEGNATDANGTALVGAEDAVSDESGPCAGE